QPAFHPQSHPFITRVRLTDAPPATTCWKPCYPGEAPPSATQRLIYRSEDRVVLAEPPGMGAWPGARPPTASAPPRTRSGLNQVSLPTSASDQPRSSNSASSRG